MQLDEAVRRYPLLRRASTLYYHYRAQRWRFDPRFWLDDPSVPIDRPIFLVGTQGGGLTLTYRILMRNHHLVSITGNSSYWAGADEMQNVLRGVLPEALGWRELDLPGWTDIQLLWLYACDPLAGYYRADASDATPELEQRFKKILRGFIRLNRLDRNQPVRFLDKSQTFTLRVGLLNEILADCRPKFVLLTRDPFAMAWRTVSGNRVVAAMQRPLAEKFDLAVQHWRNSMQAALDQEGRVDLARWRFEDVLADPERGIREICEFAELPFDPRILPQPDDRIPWGSMFNAYDRSKWYPIRQNVSKRYLEEIPDWAIDRVEASCGPLLERLGYRRPR